MERLKFWKRKGNCRTGGVRSILKCFVPCIRHKSRSPPENKIQGNRKKTTYGRVGAQFEALIQAQKRQEIIDIQEITGEEETSRKWTQESPHSAQFDETERGRRREETGLRLSDFKTTKLLGEGSFGQVVLAKKKSTGRHRYSEELFALKFVPIKRVSKVETEVLIRAVGHPFLVQLFTYFQTEDTLCYVMEYLGAGTLHSLLCRLKGFSEDLARFYTAEIVLAVKFLHKCGIVHRDIKPQNILLDTDGHCKLADFGCCKTGMFTTSMTAGVCGTDRYMAPEVRHGFFYGPEVDWWSVGSVMYDMFWGNWRSSGHLARRQRYPTSLTRDAISIITNFMKKDPSHRLGAHGDTRSILLHPFFKTVNWVAVLQKRVTPPVNPVTLKFLTVHPDAPGDAHDLGTNSSTENRHRDAIPEQPSPQLLNAKCPTIASGERGNAHESRRNISFQIVGDADERPSNSSFKTANDGSVLEGPAH